MSNFARIRSNVAVDVSADPEKNFHPMLAVEFVPVPSEVKRGWRRDEDGTWMAPSVPEPAVLEPERPQVGPVEFKLLFTSPERLKLKELRANDPVLADFFEIIEDPRLQYVDLSLGSTAAGVDHCLSLLTNAEVISESEAATRREQILSGTLL